MAIWNLSKKKPTQEEMEYLNIARLVNKRLKGVNSGQRPGDILKSADFSFLQDHAEINIDKVLNVFSKEYKKTAKAFNLKNGHGSYESMGMGGNIDETLKEALKAARDKPLEKEIQEGQDKQTITKDDDAPPRPTTLKPQCRQTPQPISQPLPVVPPRPSLGNGDPESAYEIPADLWQRNALYAAPQNVVRFDDGTYAMPQTIRDNEGRIMKNENPYGVARPVDQKMAQRRSDPICGSPLKPDATPSIAIPNNQLSR